MDASKRIRALVRSASSSSGGSLTVQAPTALPLSIRNSLTVSPSVDIQEINSWQIANLLDTHSLQQSALLYLYADTVAPQTSSTKPTTAQQSTNTKKRKSATAAEASTNDTGSSNPRRVRRCVNCRSADCPGRWGSKKCRVPLRPVSIRTFLLFVCSKLN